MTVTQYHIRKKVKKEDGYSFRGEPIPTHVIVAVNKFVLDNNIKCFYSSHPEIKAMTADGLPWLGVSSIFFKKSSERNHFLLFFNEWFEAGRKDPSPMRDYL